MVPTFLFTDIEGSTRLWEANPTGMSTALAEHDALLRRIVEANQGRVFKTVGDAFYCVFDHADHAIQASIDIQNGLIEDKEDTLPLKVRIAIHQGAAQARDQDYFGPTLNRIARLLSIANGGQILLSGAAQSATEASVPLRDLGEHLLKDLDHPIRVYQVVAEGLPQDFEPLRSLRELSHNLPIQLTSFVGREAELETLSRLIRDNRLVTLTGTGGAGKSRLAVQSAAELVDRYKDGVWFIELAALSDPSHVPGAVARALRIAETAGVTVTDALSAALQHKSLLIILDNCEHLIDASAMIAESLLRTCPGVSILATSRESLGIAGEQTFRIPSLAVPTGPEALAAFSEYASIYLFLDRANLTDPSFTVAEAERELVVQICQKLDGIPLAIELAAACCRTMSIKEISMRLNDRFRLLTGGLRTALPRQKTLRAMVDWSYDLLTPDEQFVLCNLSVFSGGWTTSILAEVFPSIPDLHELHSSLVEKSLVNREGSGPTPRFRLLQTIRDYALDRLIVSERVSEVRQAHQSHFKKLVSTAVVPLRGPDQIEWLNLLETEHDNIRTALQWCLANEDPQEHGLEMCGNLFFFWWMRSHWAEGRVWSSQMLDCSDNSKTTKARSDCLMTLGNLALYQGDYEASQTFYQRCFDMRERVGDPDSIATAKHCLAHLQQQQGNYEAAKPLYEQSIALRRQASKPEGLAGTLNNLANVEQELGNFEAAAALHHEALGIRRKLGSIQGLSQTLQNLGSLYLVQGQSDTALTHFQEALQMVRSLRDTRSIGQVLDGLAEIYYRTGDWKLATQIWSASQSIRKSAGTLTISADEEQIGDLWKQIKQEVGSEAFESAWNDGSSMDLDATCDLALMIRAL